MADRVTTCWFCETDPCSCKFEGPRAYAPAVIASSGKRDSKAAKGDEPRVYPRNKKKVAEYNQKRRAKLALLKICINGQLPEEDLKHRRTKPSAVEHGPVVEGRTKCQRCIDIHTESRSPKPAAIARAA